MRLEDQLVKEKSATQTVLAGVAGSATSFLVKWVPDTMINRAIVFRGAIFDSGIKASFRNYSNAISIGGEYNGFRSLRNSMWSMGTVWAFGYKLMQGSIVFPLQNFLQDYYASQLGVSYQTIGWKVGVGAFAGWHAGLLEVLIFHPFDSMKILGQTRPNIFNGSTLRYFWNNQSLLRRGMGPAVLRNTISNPPSWGAKILTENHLQHSDISQTYKTIICALVFASFRILFSYPFETAKVLVQVDANLSAKIGGKCSLAEKLKDTIHIINKKIAVNGYRSLYRGFLSKGSLNILSVFVKMFFFDYISNPNLRTQCEGKRSNSSPSLFRTPMKCVEETSDENKQATSKCCKL